MLIVATDDPVDACEARKPVVEIRAAEGVFTTPSQLGARERVAGCQGEQQ